MSKISVTHTIGAYQSTKWVGAWVTDTDYVLNQQVGNGGDLFLCILSHTSGALTEPGVGRDWLTNWVRQIDMLTADQIAANAGTGTPASLNPFVTSDTFSAERSLQTSANASLSGVMSLTDSALLSSINALSVSIESQLSNVASNILSDIDGGLI